MTSFAELSHVPYSYATYFTKSLIWGQCGVTYWPDWPKEELEYSTCNFHLMKPVAKSSLVTGDADPIYNQALTASNVPFTEYPGILPDTKSNTHKIHLGN